MNLLIVGSGKGSWTMRGEQLGAVLGARVTSLPTAADWRWADLVVLVKRAAQRFAPLAHHAGVPIVWDALDFWQQPTDNAKDARDAQLLLDQALADIRPTLTIGATQAMAAAARGVVLPHHSWAGLTPQPARPRVAVVGYEGNPQFLGRWRDVLTAACQRRGWRFEVNPDDLRRADLLVAFRDGVWDGWMCRQWKSGVKVVNAIAAGRPVIGQASAAIAELGAPSSVVETAEALEAAFDEWTPLETRAAAVDACQLLAPAFGVVAVADRYRTLLCDVRDRCAA